MSCGGCAKGWLRTMGDGAVGLAKVAAGIDRSDAVASDARLDVCKGCESLLRYHGGMPESADVGLLDRCAACGCLVRAKVLIETERCPDGKW